MIPWWLVVIVTGLLVAWVFGGDDFDPHQHFRSKTYRSEAESSSQGDGPKSITKENLHHAH